MDEDHSGTRGPNQDQIRGQVHSVIHLRGSQRSEGPPKPLNNHSQWPETVPGQSSSKIKDL